MHDEQFVLTPIGHVASSLVDPANAPKQGDEGAPDAWLNIAAQYREGLRDMKAFNEILVLTWLDRARRDVLVVHPRDNTARPMRGVFSTRSADRPNPIGLHRVQVLDIHETRIRVRNLEAVDGTPVLDLKPVLDAVGER
jgi:tRNA-Thr(GGU) m(6)t(6)A37 methyltransferase TsaA